MRVEILLINDGSTEAIEPALVAQPFEHLHAVQILHLRRNLGHQRAIAVGWFTCINICPAPQSW